jgi:hypothetical protein
MAILHEILYCSDKLIDIEKELVIWGFEAAECPRRDRLEWIRADRDI